MVRYLYEMGASNSEILSYQLLSLLLMFALPAIPACIAYSKGRSPGGWYLFGLLLFLPATIIVLCLNSKLDDGFCRQYALPSLSDVEDLSRLVKRQNRFYYKEDVYEAALSHFSAMDKKRFDKEHAKIIKAVNKNSTDAKFYNTILDAMSEVKKNME